ncbi:hypothetical protein B0T17DRAFT_190116 [Bombardia bombarda]|uniref:NmrA-like domain-containing protein n=1 Tax=Bombardia bombarda TaxID=252184 RepID=A0AA39X936_9PEZI|nr:hypothetical protein B0T17DRAFT_190116 [Bombardia bombarda]
MTTPSPFRNILLIGAGGSIGRIVLSALLAEPSFTITILQRASSRARLPPNPNLTVITVPDTYPTADLILAFKSQDAVVNCMTTSSVSEQYRIIDAAIAAGVRRYSPSEYGLNNANAAAQALSSSVFAAKGAVQAYLKEKAAEGRIEWMSIASGMWVAWAIPHDFMGMHVRKRRFEMFDDGEGRVSCSSEANTAKAIVVGLTTRVKETRNRVVYLQDYSVSQRELFAEVERQVGGEKFEVDVFDSLKRAAEKKEEVREGSVQAVYDLVNIGFMTGRYGGFFEKEGEILNEVLGLERTTLEEEVADGLRRLQGGGN